MGTMKRVYLNIETDNSRKKLIQKFQDKICPTGLIIPSVPPQICTQMFLTALLMTVKKWKQP